MVKTSPQVSALCCRHHAQCLLAYPQGRDHLKSLRTPRGKRWRWSEDYLNCYFGCYHELLAVPLPWPLLFSACWPYFNLDCHLYLVSQYDPVKFKFLLWAARRMFMVISCKTLIDRCLLLRLASDVWDHTLCFGYDFFFKSQFKMTFCQFQSTAELPEGLMLHLGIFTVKYIIIAPVFLNSLTLCISLD